MEKRPSRQPGLTSLFWRYLITTGSAVLALAVLWWMGLTLLLRQEFVYPAGKAADGVDQLVYALSAGAMMPEEIPYYYRWAIFDSSRRLLDPGNMNSRSLSYAESVLAGDSVCQGMLYTQYHRVAQLPMGGYCVVQYDYSMPYGSELLQRHLPEFQTCAMGILLLSWLITGAVSTHHFAGLLRRDAALLTAAARTIARQRLDTPLEGQPRVREFGETLAAMDQLRVGLARSLEQQWALEQQRRLELAALTHDLKTPLTVISGNAELLQEDELDPMQREIVDAILRSAVRLQEYTAQLRAMTRSGSAREQPEERASLRELAAGWKEIGQSLCGTKQISFSVSAVPDRELMVHRASLDRAVSNLLDNAVRYTSVGGKVLLTVSEKEEQIAVSVEDTGPGFSAESIAKGTQAFFTSDASRPQEGHLGLGLFCAEQTAKLHGGSLRLSNTAQGGKAELLLPVC